MFLIAITLLLILVGFVAFVYGTIAISKFAFRVSTGRGVATLLFPPYTLYFAFSELQEEDKDIPAASWVFGLLVTALLVGVFAQPLGHLANGRWDKLQATSPGEMASQKYGDKEDEESDEESSDDSGGEEAGAAADEESDDSESEDDEKKKEESEGASKDESGDEKSEDEKKDEKKKKKE